MDYNASNIRPFIFSSGLNIMLYAILTALNILISKHYLLELAKRHHFKFQIDNQVKAGFVQSLFSLIPALVFGTFCGKDNLNYLKASYSSILLTSSLVTAIIAWKHKKIILLDLKAIRSFAILASVSASSFFIIGLGRKLSIYLAISVIMVVGYLIRKLLCSPTTIGSVETEVTETVLPNHFGTNVVRSLLYPFDMVLENLVIIPDSVPKPYSLSMPYKTIVSPLSMLLLSILYFNELLSIYSILLMSISSLCVISLLFASSKIRKIRYLTNLYSLFVCGLMYYFLFDLLFESSANAESLLGISRMQVAALLVSPQLAIPSFCIYKHSIGMGFYKRALYATFYNAIFSLTVTHLVGSVMLPDATFLNTFQSGDLRATLMGILAFQILIFANIILQKGRLQLRNSSLCLYVLIQDYLITSLASTDN